MNPRVGFVGTNSDLCVGDLHPSVGEFSKGTADNLITDDNFANVSSGTPTPELAGSGYVPTKNLKSCISLSGKVSSLTKMESWAPSASQKDLGRIRALSWVRYNPGGLQSSYGESDACPLTPRPAMSANSGSRGKLSASTEALQTSRGGHGDTRSQSMIPESEKNCSPFRSVGSPVTAKLRSGSPRQSAELCPYLVMLQLGAQPLGRHKVDMYATKSPRCLHLPLPLLATRRASGADQLLYSSASRLGIAARHRSKRCKYEMSTEDMAGLAAIYKNMSLPSATVFKQRSASSRISMSPQEISANLNRRSRQVSTNSQPAVGGRMSSSSRTLCWATPLQLALQHGFNSSTLYGSDLSDKSRGRREMERMCMHVGEEEVEEGHSGFEISSPPAKFVEVPMDGGKGSLEKHDEEESAQKKKSTSLFSKFKRKLKKLLS
eukprot:gene5593-2614_t